MKVLLGHLDWGLGTKGPHNDPADKTLLCLHIVSNVSKWSNLFVKNGVKTSVTGSCTIIAYFLTDTLNCDKVLPPLQLFP